MKQIISTICTALFLICACNDQVLNPDIDKDLIQPEGQMKISLDMTNAPSEVVRLTGILANNNEEIRFDFILNDNNAIALVENLSSGNWTLTVNAFNANNDIIYSGTTEVTVYPGLVTPVSIHLNAATGGLEITVTWGNNSGLMAYFPFNGNANDESGNLNHGTLNGPTLSTDRFGNSNSAYYFDGVDDEIILNDRSKLDIENGITVCAWFKTDVSQWGSLVSNFDQHSPDNGYELCVGSLYEDGGFIYFECAKDDIRDGISTDNSFNDGEWHFVAATLAPNGFSRRRVFVDAIEQFGDDNPLGGSISSIGATPNYPFKIGAASNRQGPEGRANFNGIIDDVRIYRGALSKSEITLLYDGNSNSLIDDRFEDNDVQSEAADIWEYTYYHDLSVYNTDDDWYAMHISADSLSIKCDFPHSNGDINIELVDVNGRVLASSISTDDNEQIDHIVNELGSYYIHVFLSSGTKNNYTIWWDDIWSNGF